jgi:hypothetical protein
MHRAALCNATGPETRSQNPSVLAIRVAPPCIGLHTQALSRPRKKAPINPKGQTRTRWSERRAYAKERENPNYLVAGAEHELPTGELPAQRTGAATSDLPATPAGHVSSFRYPPRLTLAWEPGSTITPPVSTAERFDLCKAGCTVVSWERREGGGKGTVGVGQVVKKGGEPASQRSKATKAKAVGRAAPQAAGG